MNNLQFLVKIIQNKNNLKYQFTLLTLQKLIENDKLHIFQKNNLLRKSAKMIREDLLKYLRKRICSNNLQITSFNGDDNFTMSWHCFHWSFICNRVCAHRCSQRTINDLFPSWLRHNNWFSWSPTLHHPSLCQRKENQSILLRFAKGRFSW